MSSWAFQLTNTTCSSTSLELIKVENREQTLKSIPETAKISVGDIDYIFLLSGEESTQPQGEVLENATSLVQNLDFQPPLSLKNDTYSISLTLVTGSATVSETSQVELHGCESMASSTDSKDNQEKEAGSDETGSSEKISSSQESSQTGADSATERISEYTDAATQTWSLEQALETSSVLEPITTAGPAVPSNNDYLTHQIEEKKSIESGASVGGLVFLLLLISLVGVLYYRRLLQKKRSERSSLVNDVWRSDMEEA